MREDTNLSVGEGVRMRMYRCEGVRCGGVREDVILSVGEGVKV